MASLLNRASGPSASARLHSASVARPRVVRAPICRSRTGTVAVRAFFSFLAPKAGAPQKADPRRAELVEELVSIAEPTDAGAKAGAATREEIEELVSELAPYSVKNPLRSPLLWGDYEVLYASNPAAVGGPLKKGGGPVVFPGQKAVQRLIEPDQLVNEVTFKALGFVPGFSRQYGSIKPLSGDTFLLSIDRGELNTGVGTVQKEFDIQRRIQVLYLDETLRIARFLPDEDLPDSEDASDDEILFVFRRIEEDGAAAEEEEEEEEDDEPAPVVPKLNLPLFGGSGKTVGLATLAERQIRQQQRAESTPAPPKKQGTGFFFVGGQRGADEDDEEDEEETPAQRRRREAQEKARAAAEARSAAKTQASAARGQAEREAAAKKAAAEREAAAKRAAAEREEAKRRAEKEREEQRARAAAVKEQLAELADELREAQAAAREAAKEVAEIKREAAPVLKQASAAEAAIDRAAREAAAAAERLQAAAEERRAAEADLKEAQAVAKAAEAALKKVQERLVVRS